MTTWPQVLADPPHTQGGLWVTDRRLAIAPRSTVKHSYDWDTFDSVQMIPEARGVIGLNGQDALVFVQRLPDSPMFSTQLTPWYRYLTIEAVFAWSRGRLDQWYDELPTRLASPAHLTLPE